MSVLQKVLIWSMYAQLLLGAYAGVELIKLGRPVLGLTLALCSFFVSFLWPYVASGYSGNKRGRAL